MGRLRAPGWLHHFASVGFFCLCSAFFLFLIRNALARPLALPALSPDPLDFNEVAPGDANPQTIAPGSGSTGNVTGNNNGHYNLWIPTTATLTRIGSGGADSITVSAITGSPAAGLNSGLLNGTGDQTLSIGATRDAVASGAPAGTYTGAYYVSATYTNAGSAIDIRTRTLRVKVLTSIGIAKVNDLKFGETWDGDSSYTVNATDAASGSGTNTKQPASFTISGTNSHAYSITLPSSTTMTTGDGVGATKQIVVNAFTSNPSGSSTIGAGGTSTLSVGAARAAPIASQITGSYSGSFTVTVYYY